MCVCAYLYIPLAKDNYSRVCCFPLSIRYAPQALSSPGVDPIYTIHPSRKITNRVYFFSVQQVCFPSSLEPGALAEACKGARIHLHFKRYVFDAQKKMIQS